jgi:hypothetical protein
MSFKIGDYVIVEDGDYFYTPKGSYGKVCDVIWEGVVKVEFILLTNITKPVKTVFAVANKHLRLMTKLDKYLAGIEDEI